MRLVSKSLLILFSITLLSSSLKAQAGYSSAAMSMSKQKSDQIIIPRPEEIIVEEYANYHRHNLPLPQQGQNVELDLRWGNEAFNATTDEAIFQVGITTARITDYSEVDPVNVSLVIDKSGSMGADDKLVKTKKAMLAFVKRLRPKDHISIVEFDHNAKTVLPAQSASNLAVIEQVINNIQLGGSTNMHDGIISGYKETLKNYKKDKTNRVIILTDAITNTGVIDPEEIIKNTEPYNKEYNIDFAMIGVGVDFNYSLSRQMTSNSKTQIHFVNDADDIQKVFIDEVESLLAPVAKEPVLTIELPADVELIQLYGYEPVIDRQKIEIRLNNIDAGLTQVVLGKVTLKKGMKKKSQINASLSFNDIKKKSKVTLDATAHLVQDKNQGLLDKLKDEEVKKNFMIAHMAQQLKEMATLYVANDAQKAKDLLDITIGDVKKIFYGTTDEDIRRMLKILENYSGNLNTLAKR